MSESITLKITGPIPAKKNGKLIARGRLITDPAKQARLKEITQDLHSQLLSWWATAGAGMQTTCCPRCRIALSLPLDDCWTVVPSVRVDVSMEKGNEEATITITKLQKRGPIRPKKYDIESVQLDNLAQEIYWSVENGDMRKCRKLLHGVYDEGLKDGIDLSSQTTNL